MPGGWYATGRLTPLYELVGGRDRLADMTGIRGTQLSNYNSGNRRIGIVNARKIAAVANVSVLELGAPPGQADQAGRLILDRLARLEDAVYDALPRLEQLVGEQAGLSNALVELPPEPPREAEPPGSPRSQRPKRKRAGGA